ncbi:GNAT family N-acetyltransferase [Pseudomonas sp. UBA2684]|uniref:GNAT family N-acetyltransferase n=1 Tax=Pseudomonas sp. UBA2684 TaxID=1947311 RepID=UPI0025EFE699|nr:GNAT family N-acetyltransferase [Pseudomonas sp. UBA2684]
MNTLHLAPLPAAQDSAALDLLDRAFAADPTLRWYLFAERPGFAQRRRDYLAIYQRFHRTSGLPTVAAWRDQQLLGLCHYSRGGEQPHADNLAWIAQAISRHCGEDCLNRLDRLLAAFDQHIDSADCARIEFLAVAPGQQGQGIGSALLSHCLQDCGRPAALETAEPRNLRLYQRHAFQLRAELHLDGLHQHYLLHV